MFDYSLYNSILDLRQPEFMSKIRLLIDILRYKSCISCFQNCYKQSNQKQPHYKQHSCYLSNLKYSLFNIVYIEKSLLKNMSNSSRLRSEWNSVCINCQLTNTPQYNFGINCYHLSCKKNNCLLPYYKPSMYYQLNYICNLLGNSNIKYYQCWNIMHNYLQEWMQNFKYNYYSTKYILEYKSHISYLMTSYRFSSQKQNYRFSNYYLKDLR